MAEPFKYPMGHGPWILLNVDPPPPSGSALTLTSTEEGPGSWLLGIIPGRLLTSGLHKGVVTTFPPTQPRLER